jgi:tetratricopeptide (TPR) repeat protein
LTVKGDVQFLRAEWDPAEVYYRELLNAVGSEYDRQRSRIHGLDKLAILYHSKGQFKQALAFIDQAIDEITVLGEKRGFLFLRAMKAYILLEQGDLSRADAELEVALKDANRRDHVGAKLGILADQGMIDLEMGDISAARRAADEMRMEIERWLNPRLIRQWHWLAGHIELEEGNFGDAVAHFENAIALLPHQYVPNGDPHALYYSSLADAYFRSGETGKAREWYENVLALTSGRLIHGTRFVKSHFMLGKIYQQRGLKGEAIRSYRTFLDLWREADAAIPEIEEARRSLAELLDPVIS